MKVSELIDKLQKSDPESTLIFSVGRNCFGDNELEIELDEYEQEEDDDDCNIIVYPKFNKENIQDLEDVVMIIDWRDDI